MPEEGSTQEPVERGGGILQGRQHIAGPTMADDVSHVQQRKGTVAGPTKTRMRFGGIKFVRRIRKPWEGKRPGGKEDIKGRGRIRKVEGEEPGKGREVSVGLVRRRETPCRSLEDQQRTDIRGISRTVVGQAVLSDFDIGRAA
ncbi:hypothetical protein BY996DRAFT_6611950 [Phakopsora pachyrhizi]|nr:hypothetical protein BY996DRAFT_6611950 [Phakopsora pachyrhizi]